MTKDVLKPIVADYLDKMMDSWFEGKPLFKALGKTIVQTNYNKLDGVLDMLTDDSGNVNIDLLVKNLGDIVNEDYKIDLTTVSPFLPQRIIIISKSDIHNLIKQLRESPNDPPTDINN